MQRILSNVVANLPQWGKVSFFSIVMVSINLSCRVRESNIQNCGVASMRPLGPSVSIFFRSLLDLVPMAGFHMSDRVCNRNIIIHILFSSLTEGMVVRPSLPLT